MKKFLLKTWLLLACLLLGVGTSWAETESIEINTTNSGVTGSYADKTFTVDEVTFGFTQWMKSTNIQAKKSTTNSCYNVDAIPGTIKKITVVQTGTARAIKMYGGSSSKPTTEVTAPSTAATMEFDFSGKNYTYFSMTTPANAVYINTITIEYEATSGDGGGSTPTTYTVTVADNIANGTVTASTTSAAEGATVTLAATPATGYKFDSWNVTNASTSATITVTDNKFTMPAANVNVSATFNAVSVPEFTSLEELVAADLTSGTEVTVSFEDVPIKNIYITNSGYRNGVYFDIQKGGKDIELYYQNVPESWVAGGKLSGTLTNCPWKLYSGTWELAPASGWAWTELNYTAPAVLTAPVITTQPVSANYDLNASAQNLKVVATGNPAPTYQWYSNTTNSNENGTVLTGETNTTYKPSTAAAGTYYYYCVATNSEGSATSSVATITVKGPTVASLPFSFDGGRDDIATKDGMSQSGLGTDYSASPKLKFDTQGDNVIINFNEAAKKVTYTIKGNGTSGTYAFDVMESADGVAYTTIHSHSSISDATSYTDNLDTESRFVKFVYTTKASGNIALGKISIVAASVLDDPELAFAQPAYTFFTDDDMQVVATSSAGSTGAVTYALTDGDADAFLIDENTGDIVCETAGTYTVTATIAATTGFSSGTATCTVKIKEPVVGNSIIVAETDGGCYAMTTTCEGSYFGSIAIKKAGNKYVVSSLADILFYTKTADGKTTIQSTSNAQYVQATAAKNISYTENEYNWTNAEGILTTESYGTLQYNTSSPRFTTYTSKVGQYATIVNLANVIVGDVVTLNADCHDENGMVYGTYSNASAWVVPEDLVVSEVGVDSEGKLNIASYNTNDVVPANTGVLVSALEGGNYAIVLSNEDGAHPVGVTNALHPSSEPMAGDYLFYKLAYGDWTNKTDLGFYWGAADGAAFSAKAGGAYLAVPTGAGARAGYAFNGDEADGLEAIELNEAVTIYTLDGTQINELRKGLNIVNGKKIFVK